MVTYSLYHFLSFHYFVKKNHLFKKALNRIDRLTLRGRIVFVFFAIISIIGFFGIFTTLSNKFSHEVPLYGGTYTEALTGAPRFINPVLAYSDPDRDVTALIYNGLVRKDINSSFVPDLAHDWTISSNGKEYVFTLKPDLTFHDGKPLTSKDVLFTIEKIKNPLLKSSLRIGWEGVRVSTPDDQTIIFELEKPYAGFLQQLTVGILPAHIWGSIPLDAWQNSNYNTEPIGSGPFKLISVSRNKIGSPEKFHLRSFKHFSLGKPFIRNIIIEIFANKSDTYEAFSHGSIDALATVDISDIKPAVVDRNQVLTQPLPRVFGIFFNPDKNKLFSDTALVTALNLGINKQQIIDEVLQGYGTKINGPLPSFIDESQDDYATKKALAINLLEKGGWKVNPQTGIREKGGVTTPATKTTKAVTTPKQQLSFTLTTANTPGLEKAADVIKKSYQEIGADVTIKIYEIGTLNETSIRDRDFEALLFGQVIKHDTDTFAFWHSSQKTFPGLNIIGYTNSQVDILLESAIKESDPIKRSELYQKISDQLIKNAPVVFLYSPESIILMKNRVRNPVMPQITLSNDRFSLIYQWYLNTDRVWNLF